MMWSRFWRSAAASSAKSWWKQVGAALPLTATGYLDTSVGNSNSVSYAVRAYDGVLQSADYRSFSMAMATPLSPPGATASVTMPSRSMPARLTTSMTWTTAP